MRAKQLAACVAALVAGALLAPGGVHADPVKIRQSYIVSVANWATILFAKPEMAKHLGKSYTFEAVHFQSTPTLIQALAANEIEVANLGFTSLPLAITNAKMDDLRIFADELQDGAPGYYSNEYMVLKDSPIKKVEDLKGKVLVTNGYGSGTDIPLRIMLAKHGISDKKDVNIIEAPIPTMGAMLNERKADLVAWVLPFTANPQATANLRTLFTAGDAVGVNQLGMWVAKSEFIAKNRAAVIDFLEDALRAERWYFDPANHQEALAIAAKITKQPPESLGWVFTKGDFYRNPNGRPDLPAIAADLRMEKELGYLKTDIDVPKYADLSIVDEASKRLEK